MKLKRFRNKFISMLLTLAMLLTLFPTAVFAEDTAADRPASAEFKIMGLYALRDNGRRVSFFSYESRDNAFLTKANMTYPDSWFKLIYVIERSQPVTLELYEMKDEPAYMDEDIVSMPYAPEDDAMDTENSRVRSSLAADWVYWWAFRCRKILSRFRRGMTFIRRSRWAIRLSMKMSG